MCDVELICEKNFSEADRQIVDRFIEFQRAIIGKDETKLNGILSDDYELVHMSGKRQSKSEFIGEVMDGTLNYFKSQIEDPTIIHDDEDSASLVGDVTLTAKVYGISGEWTLDSVVNLKKVGDVWHIVDWDN